MKEKNTNLENPLISIIIPVYNVEKYLENCLNSVVNQTYKNLEIILVDDGSIDNSGKICDEFAKKDNRIITIHKENSGVSSARNKGLDIVKGEYITFVDGDDYLELNTYDNINHIINQYNVDIVRFQYVREVTKHKKYEYNSIEGFIDYSNNKKKILDLFLTKSEFGPVWSSIFKKSVISNIRFAEELKFGEDYYFYFNVILNSDNMYITNECYYHYVCNNSSVMNAFDYDKMMIRFKNNFQINILLYYKIVEMGLNDYEQNCLNKNYRVTYNLLGLLAYNSNYNDYKRFIKNLQNQEFYKEYKEINPFYRKKIETLLNKKSSFYYIKFKIKQLIKNIIEHLLTV